MSEFIDRHFDGVDGLGLYYRDYPGPSDAKLTIVCLHGLTRNSRDYEGVAAHLSARYRVLCPDVRGRGKSGYAPDPATYVPPVYVRDLVKLLHHAGVRRAAFIGTSMGGLMALMMTGLHRTLVAGVVINDVGPDIDPAGLARIGGYVGKTPAVENWSAAARQFARINALAFPGYAEGDWLRMAKRTYAEQSPGIIRPDYDPRIAAPFQAAPLPKLDLWPLFHTLRGIPSLAIRGAQSDILSAGTFARMKQEVVSLQQVTVPNRGHAPTLEEPDAVEAIDRFLATLPRERSVWAHIGTRLSAAYHLMRLTAAVLRARRV